MVDNDFTNLPYMDINRECISIYDDSVTSMFARFSREHYITIIAIEWTFI